MNRPKLRELADRLGILGEYLDQGGRRIRTSDAARETLLSIMGFDAPSEDAARGWLDELDHQERETILDPVRVVERDDATARRVRVRVPSGAGRADVEITLTEESGHVWKARRRLRGVGTIELPTRAPYGYHRVDAQIRGASGEWSADQTLIVTPASCVTPAMRLSKERVAGVVANLYSVKREHDWGIGDFGTLMMLVEWAAERSTAFVGVNPLHALFNRGWDVSPYSPVSRLFRNHIYIDVEAVPELARCPRARAILDSPEIPGQLAALRSGKLVDYDAVIALKERVLLELYRTFREGSRESLAARLRARAYDEFVGARDPDLTRYALWMTIAEESGVADWRRWPEPLHDPDSPSVRAIEEARADRIGFHKWLQFETHAQLGQVAQRARALSMDIGVYQDLAIGTSGGGSDTWSNRELFFTGASVGAPPDPYSSTGQVWGLPPMNPHALRQQRYRYWIQLLRRAFEHSGALRIDHVMGLFRSFWIPEGGTGLDGAYIRFPARDLLGILALESVRHDAIVVGEDLGTVPKEVPPALRKWGILSSKVLYFEREERGFRPASRYPALALATANTHDMAPLAGFWIQRDVDLRHQVGLLRSDEELEAARRERVRDQQWLLELLEVPSRGDGDAIRFARRLVAHVHEFLCSTRSTLVGLSLDDLTGEVDPVNVPGVGPDKYPSWRRRMRMTMEEIRWSFEVDDALRCDTRRGRR